MTPTADLSVRTRSLVTARGSVPMQCPSRTRSLASTTLLSWPSDNGE